MDYYSFQLNVIKMARYYITQLFTYCRPFFVYMPIAQNCKKNLSPVLTAEIELVTSIAGEGADRRVEWPKS